MIAIAADHAGFELKKLVKKHLETKYELVDFGTGGTDSVDYPDYVHPLAQAISSEQANRGILICGSANGVAITANKHAQVRAAIAWQVELAQLARQHNDANVICIPARFIDSDLALEIIDAFLNTDFEGGRHQNRVDKIKLSHKTETC